MIGDANTDIVIISMAAYRAHPKTLRERLSAKYPGLHVVGTYAPPFRRLSEEEDQAIVRAINATKPDVVWVGLGSPKQEVWMREHVGKIDAAALIGVGAAFDFHSGRVKWAPALIRKARSGVGIQTYA